MCALRNATLAALGIILLSAGQPAAARSGAGAPGFMSPSAFAPHGFASHAHSGRHFARHRPAFIQHGQRTHFDSALTAFASPFFPFTDWAPIASPEAEPASPEVIVMPVVGAPAPHQTTPPAPLDFSYVAGCHAIPNGYHCDTNADHAKP